GRGERRAGSLGRGFEKTAQLPLHLEQPFEMLFQRRMTRTGLIQVGRALGRISKCLGRMKDLTFVHRGIPPEAVALRLRLTVRIRSASSAKKMRNLWNGYAHARAFFSSLSRNARA